jgi:hypothetical protein
MAVNERGEVAGSVSGRTSGRGLALWACVGGPLRWAAVALGAAKPPAGAGGFFHCWFCWPLLA